jgi:hypothetical protein
MRVSSFDVPTDLDADEVVFEQSLKAVESVVDVAGQAGSEIWDCEDSCSYGSLCFSSIFRMDSQQNRSAWRDFREALGFAGIGLYYV